MAKRDEIAQQGLIILDAKGVADIRGTADRLGGAGGRILHRYGARVLIGEVPPAATARRRRPAWRALGPHRGGPREAPRADRSRGARASPPGTCASPAGTRPRRRNGRARACPGIRRRDAAHPARWTRDDPCRRRGAGASGFGPALDDRAYLIGSVAVGVIMVEGPTADLQFSDDGTHEGRGRGPGRPDLARHEGCQGRRLVRLRHPAAGPAGSPPNPALTGLRAARGALARPGHGQDRLRARTSAASASTSRPSVPTTAPSGPTSRSSRSTRPSISPTRRSRGWSCSTRNDGWGPDNIDRVFTHETGHIFGCPDEYAASGCSTTTKAGYLREVERQLPERRDGVHADASWPATRWAMCTYTPTHFGWRDTDGDGALDPVDPVGNPNPLVDLGRLCSLFPVICQIFGLGGVPGGPVGVAGGVGVGVAGRRAAATRGRPGRAPAPGAHAGGDGPRREGRPRRGAALPRGARTQVANRGRRDIARERARG